MPPDRDVAKPPAAQPLSKPQQPAPQAQVPPPIALQLPPQPIPAKDPVARIAQLEAENAALRRIVADAREREQLLIVLLEEARPDLSADLLQPHVAVPVASYPQPSLQPAPQPAPPSPVIQSSAHAPAAAPILSEDEKLAMEMQRLDTKERQAELDKKTYSCPICLSEVTIDALYLLDVCNHRFCMSCLELYLTEKINGGKVTDIPCPVPNCNTKISDKEIDNLVSDAVYDKFERFRLEQGLAAMEDVRFCPKPSCGVAMVRAPDDPKMVCQGCGYSYCFDCQEEWHAPFTCDEIEERIALGRAPAAVAPPPPAAAVKQPAAAPPRPAAAVHPVRKSRRQPPSLDVKAAALAKQPNKPAKEREWEKKAVERVKGVHARLDAWLKANTKHCPKCHVPIEKNGGCNHMTCIRCHRSFCWLCLSTYTVGHFASGKCSQYSYE